MVLVLVPYLALSFFVHPSADDYTYANGFQSLGFLEAQKNVYESWSGRYVATALMSVNPVSLHWLEGYKWIPIALFLALFGSIFLVLSTLTSSLLDRRERWVATLGFFCLFLYQLPSPSQAFYWMAGSFNYMVPLILVNISLSLLIPYVQKGSPPSFWLKGITLAILSGLIIGSNETIMVVWGAMTFISLLFFWKLHHRLSYSLILLLIVEAALAIFVLMAPGNAVRGSHFENSHRPFYAIVRTVGASFEHIAQFISLPLILATLLALPLLLGRIDRCHWNFKKTWPWVWLSLGALFFCSFFPALWSMGGQPPKRVDNMTYLFFLFFWWVLLAHLVGLKRPSLKNWLSRQKWYHWNGLATVFLVLIFFTGNNGRSIRDLALRAQPYDQVMKKRYQILRQNQGMDIEVPAINKPPKTIFFGDIVEDPTHWHNVGVAQFFNLRSIRVTPHE